MKKLWERYNFEMLTVVMIILISVGIVGSCEDLKSKLNKEVLIQVQKTKNRNKITFDGWVKLTGNPKKLTLEEFIVMKDQGLIK